MKFVKHSTFEADKLTHMLTKQVPSFAMLESECLSDRYCFLSRRRLLEGFHFCSSNQNGIITMVKEVPMQVCCSFLIVLILCPEYKGDCHIKKPGIPYSICFLKRSC